MKLIVLVLLNLFILLLVAIFLFGLLRSIQTQNDPRQKEFLGGTVPKDPPDGLYKGSILKKTTWEGKRFSQATSSGINVFKDDQGNLSEKYSFKISKGPGVADKNLQVIKIDYSQNKSPWWLKYILDEIVEVSPGKFLGKLHVTIIPSLPLSLGYFRLEK